MESLYLAIVVFLLGYCGVVSSDSFNVESEGNFPMTSETNLTNDLLRRYKIHGIDSLPRRNTSTKLTVWVGMRLVKMDIDEKSQTLSTTVWVRMRWTDEVLKWNPDDYGGTKSVMLPRDKIWTPDSLTVTNTWHPCTPLPFTSVEDMAKLSVAKPRGSSINEEARSVLIKVYNTGVVLWFPLQRFNSECLIDLTDYPYDVHTCALWVQSLSWPSTQLDLKPYKFSNNNPWDLDTFLESYKLSQPWEIMSNATERVEHPRKSVILMWSKRVALKFTLTLKRRPSFISFLLRFPVIVLSFMAILIFCLPPERPDRHMFAMSLFASFMILLLVLVDKVPPSAASIPKLIYVYCANLCVVIICISCSVFVIHVTRRGSTGHTPPKCLQKIFFEILAKICFIHPGRLNQIDYHPQKERNENSHISKSDVFDESQTEGMSDKAYNIDDNFVEKQQLDTGVGIKKAHNDGVVKENYIVNVNTAEKQWKLVALILDRMFAGTFLIINVMIVAFLFPKG